MKLNWKQITASPIEAIKRKRLIKSFVSDLSVAAAMPEELESRIEGLKVSYLSTLGGQEGDSDFRWQSAVIYLLTDLAYQRWSIKFERGHLFVLRPENEEGREGLRTRLLSRRNRQLRETPVRQFIATMEKWRLYGGDRVSILSLMCDGRVLARRLQEHSGADAAEVIRPYLQIVSSDADCEYTGFRLIDIWRYFRHTWSNPYESIPGRSLLLLVRDAGMPFHPIIGIAALSSAAVRLSARDRFIGWDTDQVIAEIAKAPSERDALWLEACIQRALGGVYVRDFIQSKVICWADLEHPNQKAIKCLRAFGTSQKETHHRLMVGGDYKPEKRASSITEGYWEQQAETPLFRSKRALELANLLEMKSDLEAATGGRSGLDGLNTLLNAGKGRDLLSKAIRVARSMTVGTEIADLTVCGAIAPYNHLAAGKLVAMLATSPEAVLGYKQRYKSAESIIASSVAGRSVKRKANLVFVGTTSLYGKRPNQYERISYPTADIGGQAGDAAKYHFIHDVSSGESGKGATKGVGTFHFSPETVRAFEEFSVSELNGWRVNNVFGEGTSPKMRAVREGVKKLGFNEDELLIHGIGKCLYGVPLVRNLRDYLLGFNDEPDYIFSFNDVELSSKKIADHWFTRWASHRSTREDVLEKIRCESLVHPIRHHARVMVPKDDELQLSLLGE